MAVEPPTSSPQAVDLQAAGFRLLLRTGTPVTPGELAAALRTTLDAVVGELAATVRRGCARIGADGSLVAIAGLSVVPDRHEIEIAGRCYWTWCAFDAVGILAALGATGTIRTTDPSSGAALTLEFDRGAVSPSSLVLFLPEMRECSSVIDQWCPNANIFETDAAARRWAGDRGLRGRVLPLAEALNLGAGVWQPLLPVRLIPS